MSILQNLNLLGYFSQLLNTNVEGQSPLKLVELLYLALSQPGNRLLLNHLFLNYQKQNLAQSLQAGVNYNLNLENMNSNNNLNYPNYSNHSLNNSSFFNHVTSMDILKYFCMPGENCFGNNQNIFYNDYNSNNNSFNNEKNQLNSYENPAKLEVYQEKLSSNSLREITKCYENNSNNNEYDNNSNNMEKTTKNIESELSCSGVKENKNFICNYEGCGKSFDFKWILERHRNSHFCFKLFKCEYPTCCKSYKSRENLHLHIKNKHLGVKPYICRFCTSKFSHRNGIFYQILFYCFLNFKN